ncbi:protein transport Sec1a [Citrus sinensis]|nr:protein transport Sec1a [Citrus sinensis]
MSFSDSETSSQGGEYKFFRQFSRDRLLHEMLESTNADSKSWKVLIMDKVTVKVMSHSCKMADITDRGVSCNTPIPKELVNHIKSDTSVLPRIGALREMNLEYFPIDRQAFITDHERALEELFGDNVQNTRQFDTCLNTMAKRIATVFASMKEFPMVRYRAPKASDASTTTFRDLIPSKLATAVWNCIEKYKSIPNFPQTETCELLILDRSVDQIAPVIHEWTYDAMCHDLLDMDGNKYVLEVPSKTGGQPEKKEVLLEDHDPVWLELRHAHIADASERLHDKMTNFVSKNKAAQIQQSSRDGGELSTRDLQKIVQALPQYSEQVDKLSLHVEDLVFGDAGAKDVINFLRMKQDVTPENKLRLLMIYASVYPEKFEGDKASKLMQLARLSSEDMKIVNNMRLLAGSLNSKKSSTDFSLKFDGQKTKQAARKERPGEEETWALFKFYPIIEELIENLCKGELPKSDYPCMNHPSSAEQESTSRFSVRKKAAPATTAPSEKKTGHSVRSRRTPSWAKPQNSDDGYSSDSILNHAVADLRKMGQRIFVFMIGGATRSELRACYKLTTKLRREVVLGSTSFNDPPEYISKMKVISDGKI